MNMSGLSSTARVTIRSVSGSGVECGTPGIAPREPLAEVDELAAALELEEGDELGETELDGGLDADVVGLDGSADVIADGAAAVPPTLAQLASNTVVAAIEASRIDRPRPRTGRSRVDSGARIVVGRPCDISSFCQSG
jgi:hypothetical protein